MESNEEIVDPPEYQHPEDDTLLAYPEIWGEQ